MPAPEIPEIVAESAIPFGPSGWKAAHLIPSGTAIPGLRDQPYPSQHWILRARFQNSTPIVETLRLACHDGREIESESVDPGLFHPVPQAIRHQLQHARMAYVQRVAGAAV